MSLPVFLKFAYNYGTEEVIRRGKRIFHTHGVQFLDVDHLLGQVRFRVRNDQYHNFYTVTISKFNDEQAMSVRCQCPYNLGEICRHEVAALFQLNDMSAAGFFEDTKIVYDQNHTLVRMRQVSDELISVFTAPDSLAQARQWADEKRVRNIEVKGERLSAEVPDGDIVHKIVLRQNDERYFDTSCGCEESSHPLCRHKAAVFLQVLRERGPSFFRTMQNWDAQKEKLLALYGYSLQDDLSGKFDFVYQEGKPILKVLDPDIKKITVQTPAAGPAARLASPPEEEAPQKALDRRIGIVADPTASVYPGVQWRLIAGDAGQDTHSFSGPVEALDLQQYVNAARFSVNDRDLLPVIRKLGPEDLLRYLKKNLPFGDLLDDYRQVLGPDIAPELRDAVWEYLLPRYHRLLSRYTHHPLCFVHEGGRALSSTTITPVAFSSVPAQPALRLLQAAEGVDILLHWETGTRSLAFGDTRVLNPGLVMEAYTLHAVSNIPSLKLAEEFLPDGRQHIPAEAWPEFLEHKIMAWRAIAPVHFDPELIEHTSTIKPSMRLYLSERDRVLVLQPAFMYGLTEIRWGYEGDITVPHGGKVRIIRRQPELEAAFLQKVQNLHSDIGQSAHDHFFYLASDAVLVGSWFFRFMDAMREAGVTVLGLEGLKKLRISTHKPKTEVKVSSGIDWFDTEVAVAFGEQQVSIADIKKALAQQQHFVPLQDGSIGLLPEEWLKKYSLLIKMGESHGGKLRLKKFHFSVLDALLEEVDEETIQRELE
jgi:non-specific serine/threonine protein kinase